MTFKGAGSRYDRTMLQPFPQDLVRAVVGAHKTHESPEIIVSSRKVAEEQHRPGFSTSASRVNAYKVEL